MDCVVRIYLDEKPLIVPETVDCHHAARGVLGLRRGEGVECEGRVLAFPETGWTFGEGQRYRTVTGDVLLKRGVRERDERDRKDPWTMNPDWWRLGPLGRVDT